MKIQQVNSQKDRIDGLFTKIEDMVRKNAIDLELQGQLSRYLCVLVSGLLEISVKSICTRYAEDKASPQIANFVTSTVPNLAQNPKIWKIERLVRYFDGSWADDFILDIDDEQKSAVDSVVTLRNQIAHGEQAGISLGTIRSYYDNVIPVIEYLESLFEIQ